MNDAYVPMNQWSKDHWSTLAYVETVMVDCAGFQIGADPRMRSNRRHTRVMQEECARPKRTSKVRSPCLTMDPSQGTRLKDGTVLAGHDDWMCVQDMAEAGLFTVNADGVEPGQTLHLSPLGQDICAQLRAHKAQGGQFAGFSPSVQESSQAHA